MVISDPEVLRFDVSESMDLMDLMGFVVPDDPLNVSYVTLQFCS